MPKLSTLKGLGSLFRSSINSTPATTTAAAAAAKTSPAVDKSLKHFVSSLDASSASTFKRTLVKFQKRPQPSKPPSPAHFSSISVDTSCSNSEDLTRQVTHDISSILSDGLSVDLLDSEVDNGGKPSEDAFEEDAFEDAFEEDAFEDAFEDALEEDALEEDALLAEDALEEHLYENENALIGPRFTDLIYFGTSFRQKLSYHERKQKCGFKKDQLNNVSRLVDSCVARLGIDAALNLFGKLRRVAVIKAFNALLKICIDNAITTDDETVALEQVSNAFKVFMSMKERGFPIEEESYGQVLLYLIDRGMVEQYYLFGDVIIDSNTSTPIKLCYYESLLYRKLKDEGKAEEFWNCNFTSDGDGTIGLRDVDSRAVVDGGLLMPIGAGDT